MEVTYSVADLKARASSTTSLINIDLLLLTATDYQRFVELVDKALDWIAQELSRNPELHKKQSEDQLTIQVVSLLRAMTFTAHHETKVGGHCDVVIEYKFEFLWLGEAKIFDSDYSWLFKGFEQLNTRYSTGNPNQNSGGMIIYSFKDRIDRMMKRWMDHLEENFSDIAIEDCPVNQLAKISTHPHKRTGLKYRVRHVPISLYFDPQDE